MGNENSKVLSEVDEILEKEGSSVDKTTEVFDIIDDIASIQSLISDEEPSSSADKENATPLEEKSKKNSRRNSASWIEKIGRYDELVADMKELRAQFAKAQADKLSLREQLAQLNGEAENEAQKGHERLAGLLSEFKKVGD